MNMLGNAKTFEELKPFMTDTYAIELYDFNKYNQLLRIEEELGDVAYYPKRQAFKV